MTCRPSYWQISKPGHALVRLDNMTRDLSGFGFMATWQVQIALSQDIGQADQWIDAHAGDLIAALSPEMVVGRLEPIELVLDTGKVPAVLIEGTRAA